MSTPRPNRWWNAPAKFWRRADEFHAPYRTDFMGRPREGVWSRRISEGLERCEVIETFETGSIVVVNETVEEGIAIGMRSEQSVSDTAFGLPADGFDDAA